MTHSDKIIDGQDKDTNARVDAALAYFGSSDHNTYKSQRISNHGESIFEILDKGVAYMKAGGSEQFMRAVCQ